MCFCGGTILVDPDVLPLPVLTWTAASCNADVHLPETLLTEILRLGELAHPPMQQRWVPAGSVIQYDTTLWSPDALDDLIYLLVELSGAVLDL
jgi:hypothetical protein